MSLQLSDIEFFYLLCTSHETLNEQVRKCNKPGNLVDQVDCSDSCAWSYRDGKPACLRLIIPEYFFQSTSAFHIAGTLQSSDLNKLSNAKWYADKQVNNTQILALKFLCFGYKLPGQLKIGQTQYLLRLSADKREVLQLLFHFDSQEDLECHLQLLELEKYPFITRIKTGE